MMRANQSHGSLRGAGSTSLLPGVIAFWGIAFAVVTVFWWITSDGQGALSDYYLVPWTVLTAVVLLAPSLILLRRGTFDLFHPLVFAVWTYLFPAFVIGALIITAGLNEPYFFSFIDSPETNLPLSLMYICLGFLGMCAGFVIPHAGRIGDWMRKRIPNGEWSGPNIWIAGAILIILGVGFNIVGFVQGLLGYQRVSETAIFDGLISFLSTVLTVGFVLLWTQIFREKHLNALHYLVIGILLILIPFRMFLLGNRAGLLVAIVPIGVAFAYSGRKLRLVHGAVFGVLVFVALIIGILYGTAFREIKGSEERVASGAYFEQVLETGAYLSRSDPWQLLSSNAEELANRIENLSSLAVVVSNHERLAPYEANYGIENNIVNDLSTSLIPRFIWSDKPPTIDPRLYSDLYFNYSENSFAMTPVGDLLRNFGVFGIPIGMFIVGFYFRIIYSFLITGGTPTLWGVAAYFPLLTVINYEGFYSTFIPSVIRVGIVILVPLLILHFLLFRRGLAGEASP